MGFWTCFRFSGVFSFLGSVFLFSGSVLGFLEVFPVFEKCFLFSGTVLVSWKWLRFSGSTLDFVGFGFSQSDFCFLEVFWFSRGAFSFVWRCVGFSGSGLGLLEKLRVFWKWVGCCASALGFLKVLLVF